MIWSINLTIVIQDRQLEGCVRDIILAGSNDLRLLLLWDVLCLLKYPDYYDKIIEEIQDVIGKEAEQSILTALMDFD